MRTAERETIRDMHSLVQDGGYMLTVNPCSDSNASQVCHSVVEYATKVKHDGVLVVERNQRRGRTIIDRPHVHWVLNMGEKEAQAIEKEFADQGLNVKLTLVYDARRLCWYLSKDPEAAYYIAREEDHTGSGTPPSAAMEQRREGVTVAPAKDTAAPSPRKAGPLQAMGLLYKLVRAPMIRVFNSMVLNTTPLVRLVRVGMTRAP